MELLGDVGHVEPHFGQFGDSVSASSRKVHGMAQTYHSLKWKLILVYLEIVLILTQDRCTVCAECTTSLDIVSDAPNGNPW